MARLAILKLCVTCLAALGAAGCATDRDTVPDPEVTATAVAAAEVPVGFRMVADERSGCRYPVPRRGVAIESRHFDGAPIHKIRHQITLASGDRPLVRIDIWDDPQRRSLSAWADEHQRFLLDDEHTTTSSQIMTRSRLEGLLLRRPASPQAAAYTTALFSDGGRVFRVTCLDADDGDARQLFAGLIDGFEPGRQP